MIDKERAIALRKAGASYAQIADALNCSLAWTKKNLRGIKKEPEKSSQQLNIEAIKLHVATIENELNKIKEYLNE